ncbi:MAG TPA: hypothetical protein DEQ20_00910 [Desulfobulbaceae bacterium]|nr:MAG: hypothetical protein A2520_06130 [Deltaproteobacteria bacterium RIFOXYD12_FULL_53_23]HCC53477.1 hypothetical protein [Desulfobulbaceae bacterium]
MWPFTRKLRQRSAAVSQQPPVVGIIAARGLHDLSKNDAELRVWLPEEGRAALDAIADRLDVVRAKYLREFLVTYLYGLHELLKMQTEQTGLYYVPPPSNEPPLPLYSRARTEECIPGLGKNIVPLKLYLPQRMKDDLQTLGDRAGVPLSQFVREVLVAHFFGQAFWPDRLRNWFEDQERVVVELEQGVREAEIFHPEKESCPDESDRVIVERW